MHKIATITRSEYLRRVTSKGFIIATFLAPVLLVGVFAVAVGVGVMTQDADRRALAVLDETGQLGEALVAALPDRYAVHLATVPEDSLRAEVRRGALDGYFVLPAGLVRGEGEAQFVSARGSGGFTGQALMQERLAGVVRQARLREAGAPEQVFTVLEQRVPLRSVVLTEEGEAADASWLYSGLGYLMGFIIYIAMFVYGAMVMRGVIEEKANRIVEVIASSARPFELMMGKVLGIGAAGLTQFALWAVLRAAAFAVVGPALFTLVATPDPAAAAEAGAALEAAGLADFQLPPVSVFVYFLLYFIGGYLLYASLFAAVGSAVESESDAQSLQAPIMVPVILPALFLPFIADNPEAPLSVALSLFPLFSPILMPVRIASVSPPFWEIAASLVLLALGFVAAIWLAARIYRVGILMYGKKASFRDLARWARTA
jgi:ABC-2 type transport system permease protein